jgi:hypothetical protein
MLFLKETAMPSRQSVRRERPGLRPLRLEPLEQLMLPGFLAPLAYQAGSEPFSVAVGDFNGDGTLDLAVANYAYPLNVQILLGNGDGTFQPAVGYVAGGPAQSVAVGDFNGDNILDLAVANGYSNTVSVLLGNGNGTFQAARILPTGGTSPLSVAVGDFNGDGLCDIAVAGTNDTFGGAVSVLLSNGDGSFHNAHSSTFTDQPFSVAVGDFNGDGALDVATANYASNTVSVLLGTGDGSFGSRINYHAGQGPVSVAVEDFNGDGTSDLAAADSGDFQGNGYGVSVLLGNGNGSFQAQRTFAAGSQPASVAVGDFNGDGIKDLAVADDLGGVSVLLGNGDGSFETADTYAAASGPHCVAVGDFNGDGSDDLAAANSGSNDVSILLNDNIWPTAPRSGGQQPSDSRAAAATVEPRAAPVLAVPSATDVLPTDVGTSVLGSPGGVTAPGPNGLPFRAGADQGSAAAPLAPSDTASPETPVGGALTGGPPTLALLDRLFAQPTSGWGSDLLAEQPRSSAVPR